MTAGVDRKEVAVILVLAALVLLLATVRLFQTPPSSRPADGPVLPARRHEARAPSTSDAPAIALARRIWPYPLDRYVPRDADVRSLFDAAERVYVEALFVIATNPASAQKLFDAAIATYQSFSKQYPDEPAAEVALLRIGQCYTLMKRYPDAARTYDSFLEAHPGSDLRPMALLWSGDSHLELDHRDLARPRLEEVIHRYGDSPFVEGAKLRLDRLDARPKP